MRRTALATMRARISEPTLVTFIPSMYSLEELRFFLDHLGESTTVASYGGLPPGVNLSAVADVFEAVTQYEELRKVHKREWQGIDALRDTILRYLTWYEKAKLAKERGRVPKHASMYAFDGRRRAHKGGIGADCNIVRSEILPDGTRRGFDLILNDERASVGVVGDGIGVLFEDGGANPMDDKVDTDWKIGVITCSICHKAENFDLDSKQSHSMAAARIMKHLKTVKREVERHRLLYRAATS